MGKLWFCPECEGSGEVSVAYRGRVTSLDPADWNLDECQTCEGFGYTDEKPARDPRPYTPSKRRWWRTEAIRKDPLLRMRETRGLPGFGSMGPHLVYAGARKDAMKPARLPKEAA